MERITISLDDGLLRDFDAFMARRGYDNRSEAFRDLIREKLDAERIEHGEAAHCIGTLSYVYDHQERELASRLTHSQHDHHDLAVSTLHVHLDHDACLETVILRGRLDQVREFANSVIARPGVRHGHLHLVPAEQEMDRHRHGAAAHAHVHSHPKS